MRIRRISANLPGFREVRLNPGFNLVVADRVVDQNGPGRGLGKTSLIEIVNYCLGANLGTAQNLVHIKALDDSWAFALDLELDGQSVRVTRGLRRPNEIRVHGDLGDDRPGVVEPDGSRLLRLGEWRTHLGERCYGLSADRPHKYVPGFRSLFAYSARSGPGAFVDPFRTGTEQKAWQVQLSNAFLLGLNWRTVASWQQLKQDEAALRMLSDRNLESIERMEGGLGELESERIRVAADLAELRRAIGDFRVVPQYRDAQLRLDKAASRIKELISEITLNENLLDLYSERMAAEPDVGIAEVVALYEEIGITLAGSTRRSLDEVIEFHRTVTRNRRDYLQLEMSRLRTANTAAQSRVRRIEEEQRQALRLLSSGGALDDLAELQARFGQLSSRLETLDRRAEDIRRLRTDLEKLRTQRQVLRQQTFIDHYERREQWTGVVATFARITNALFGEPGDLVIDVTDSGYAFRTKVRPDGGRGGDRMDVFAYDLTLAATWADRTHSPGMLIHDSAVFERADDRQLVRALSVAASLSAERSIQYVATINSEVLPEEELAALGVDLDSGIVLRLTDAHPGGALFGQSF
ncbi:DUF2326 domain-containing protein [Micromonospora sp. WMMA1363]|uniref:DUF2326 domain-containing protein n=1 Tax=Micromonospora sp. WMMA1363 TaxID=3053985 RepID=UPI00259CCFD0|nr:DUF2326 domain-containing protein [Micromonospora sp. WMMA1363]MDM4721447.1 DUF2326 domain-containing protein [Micromonospora sp. WMMA1363]